VENLKVLTFPVLFIAGMAAFAMRPRIGVLIARFAALSLPVFEAIVAVSVYWPEQQAHRALGHWLIAWAWVVCALFLGVAMGRAVAEKRWWSLFDGLLAIAVLVLALLTAVTAYSRGDIEVTPQSELRFRILHVVAFPMATLFASIGLAVRGWRYDRLRRLNLAQVRALETAG
jgi:hypothetical protein